MRNTLEAKALSINELKQIAVHSWCMLAVGGYTAAFAQTLLFPHSTSHSISLTSLCGNYHHVLCQFIFCYYNRISETVKFIKKGHLFWLMVLEPEPKPLAASAGASK